MSDKDDFYRERYEEKENAREKALAEQLAHRLNEYLDKAQLAVVPPGSLGAGMQIGVTMDTNGAYDSVNGAIVVDGSIKIKIKRPDA